MMNILKFSFWVLILGVPTGFLMASSSPVQQPAEIRIDGNRFLLKGSNFRIQSVGLEPFMPGEMPPQPPVKLDYHYALSKIKELNCNTVYFLTGSPENIPPAFFQQAKAQGIYVILGLWFSAEADDYHGHKNDFQSDEFKEHVKGLIRALTDKYHHLEGVDYSSQILYVTLGNEFLEHAVAETKWHHRDITSYTGHYAAVAHGHPVECFLAEMVDYFKTYEAEHYGQIHYVSHHTWPPVSPKPLKNDFLDVISYNLYSYWPESVKHHKKGSSSGTPYQGALEEIAVLYPAKPVVVSEVGVSVAPKGTMISTTEAGQATEIAARWQDIVTANRHIAGASIHQLFDQWWKNFDSGDKKPSDAIQHDPGDTEQWFGIIEVGGNPDKPEFRERPAFDMLKKMWMPIDPPRR